MRRKNLVLIIVLIIYANCEYFNAPKFSKEKINENLNIIHNRKLQPSIPKNKIVHPKITIIIPVYNGKKYLKDSITNLQYQTLREIEIFYVNDGSTDDTQKIISEYQNEDKRIRIQNNGINKGILYSRISAALNSKGEYFTFLDVDDLYFRFNLLEEIYLFAKKNNPDFVQFTHFIGNYTKEEGYNTAFVFTTNLENKIEKMINQPEIKNNFYDPFNRKSIFSSYVFDKLYSRKLIKEMANIIGTNFWNENLSFTEDYLIQLSAVKVAESAMVMVSIGGIWHRDNSPNGMSSDFDIINNKLKYPKKVNKKLADNLYINERIFNITENESDAENLILGLISTMAINKIHIQIIALSSQTERFLNFLLRYMNWKYSSNGEMKEKVRITAWDIVMLKKDYKLLEKFRIFYEKKFKQLQFEIENKKADFGWTKPELDL